MRVVDRSSPKRTVLILSRPYGSIQLRFGNDQFPYRFLLDFITVSTMARQSIHNFYLSTIPSSSTRCSALRSSRILRRFSVDFSWK